MKKLAVIVPCYNEEAVIEESYRRTKEVLVKLPNPTEIIYINDGSQDKTRSLLDHIAATDRSHGERNPRRAWSASPLRSSFPPYSAR